MRRALRLHTRADSGRAVTGINTKDHHVVAVALDAEANLLVTNDQRLRREIDALNEPLQARSADEFAVGLVDNDAEAIEAVIDELVAKRVSRPVTRDELVRRLTPFLPSFTERLETDR